MKKNIYSIISFLMLFCFISCNNIVSDKAEANNEEVSVSFSFGYSRAIVSVATPENYEYSLKGTFNGETKDFCEKVSYTDFLQKTYDIFCGDWTFEITAYNGYNAVFSDSKNVTIIKGENNINFSLHAIPGGYGSVSVKLKFPENKGVAKVTAALYKDITAADSGTSLELASDSSVTFFYDSVPSGKTQIIKFFLYDSNNFCIGNYSESVFLVAGDSVTVTRNLAALNSFTATVSLTLQDQPYNDSFLILKAVKDNREYILQPVAGSNLYTASLPLGVYNIYKVSGDTGVSLTVSADGNSNAAVNVESQEYNATADSIAQVLASLAGEETIFIGGRLSYSDIKEIGTAITKSSYPVKLDLTYVKGLEKLPDSTFRNCTKLTSIKMPSSLTTIGNNAFAGCSSLASIEIPSSVSSIGNYAFYGCTSIESIEIPSLVTSIGDYAFRGCTSLASIEIPSTVTSIGNYAFYGCKSIESIEIPSSITSI